jgi:hypothetical protein
MPGPKPRFKKAGCTNWTTKLLDMPDKYLILTKVIAARKDIPLGELLTNYIVTEATKEAKKLKIEF